MNSNSSGACQYSRVKCRLLNSCKLDSDLRAQTGQRRAQRCRGSWAEEGSQSLLLTIRVLLNSPASPIHPPTHTHQKSVKFQSEPSGKRDRHCVKLCVCACSCAQYLIWGWPQEAVWEFKSSFLWHPPASYSLSSLFPSQPSSGILPSSSVQFNWIYRTLLRSALCWETQSHSGTRSAARLVTLGFSSDCVLAPLWRNWNDARKMMRNSGPNEKPSLPIKRLANEPIFVCFKLK